MLAALLLTAAGATSTTAAMRNEVIVIARQSLQGHGHDAAKRARRLRSRHPNPKAVDELWGLASLMGGHHHDNMQRNAQSEVNFRCGLWCRTVHFYLLGRGVHLWNVVALEFIVLRTENTKNGRMLHLSQTAPLAHDSFCIS